MIYLRIFIAILISSLLFTSCKKKSGGYFQAKHNGKRAGSYKLLHGYRSRRLEPETVPALF